MCKTILFDWHNYVYYYEYYEYYDYYFGCGCVVDAGGSVGCASLFIVTTLFLSFSIIIIIIIIMNNYE
jgi:hypothetical protein